MSLLFLAVSIICSGGILAIVFRNQFILMKAAGVLSISVGCLIGLGYAVNQLFHSGQSAASFTYLNRFSLTFKTDGLSAFFLIAIFAVSMMAAIYSFHYMSDGKKPWKTAFSYLFFSLLVAAMALVVTADNMISFMLNWEIMSLASFFLVLYNYESSANRSAGYLYFIFSHVGAMFLLAAFGVMYSHTGSFDFTAAATLPDSVKMIVFLLFFLGFGSKAGVFPVHVWLPHAHPAAPSHISAVMSGVMIKTGIYGIVKMYAILGLDSPMAGIIVCSAGMISGILGVVYAIGQHDLKRLLAYHSVENIGIILIGMGIGMIGVSSGNNMMAVLGFSGGLLHVLNHSIFKSLLFMGAGMVIQKTGTGAISCLGGLLKKMKVTGITFLIGSIAISGLPPFNGFVSEFFIYLAGFKGVGLDKTSFIMSHLAIISLAIIGGLALACFTKVMGVIFQGEPRHGFAEHLNENEPMMLVPMVLLAGACALIGLFPKLVFIMALKGVASLGPLFSEVPIEPFIRMTGHITLAVAIFITVFLIILVLRFFLYRGKPVTAFGTWDCGFTRPTPRMQYTGGSYGASILEFFEPVAPLGEDHPAVSGLFPKKTHYERHISDIAEVHMGTVIVKPVLAIFDRLRWIQHGDIHLYIAYILLAIVALLFFV